MPDQALLPETMTDLLARAGVDRDVLQVRPLGGGVSSDVHEVITSTDRLVVKVALPRLKVQEEWFASVTRAGVERRAIALASRWTPGHVPDVIGWDDETGALVLLHAGDDLVPWKPELLAGRPHPTAGPELARLLATWQRHGPGGVDSLGPDAARNFYDLRTEPFYRTTAARLPALADPIADLIDEAAARRDCLVHGDFSPKNILVGPRTVVLDWEVAHLGDSAYDAGFLTCHLLLKTIARPATDVDAVLDGFTTELARRRPDLTWERVWRHTGAMILSRLVAKSRVDYLTPEGADRARRLGRDLLLDPHDGVLLSQELTGATTTTPMSHAAT